MKSWLSGCTGWFLAYGLSQAMQGDWGLAAACWLAALSTAFVAVNIARQYDYSENAKKERL